MDTAEDLINRLSEARARMDRIVRRDFRIMNWFHTKWICSNDVGDWSPSETFDVQTREADGYF